MNGQFRIVALRLRLLRVRARQRTNTALMRLLIRIISFGVAHGGLRDDAARQAAGTGAAAWRRSHRRAVARTIWLLLFLVHPVLFGPSGWDLLSLAFVLYVVVKM